MFLADLTTSFLSILIAEIGDKTQLLTLFLATRFKQKYTIIVAIIVATVLNHIASAYLGIWLTGYVSANLLNWLVAISFILIGLWILVPDKDDLGDNQKYLKYGVFFTTLILFFLAEIGDKTQVATIVMAVSFNSVWAVILGSSLGLVAANLPVVFLGNQLMRYIPLKLIRILACLVFITLGLIKLVFG